MKFRSFALRIGAASSLAAVLLLTACGGLGGGYYPVYYPPLEPSHSSGSASDSNPGGASSGSAVSSGSSSRSTSESSSSGSSSASTPASSAPSSSEAEPPASSAPALTPEQQLAAYRAEVLRLLNAERAKEKLAPLSMENADLTAAAQKRAEELVQVGKKPKPTRPDSSSYYTIFEEYHITLPVGNRARELNCYQRATPAQAVNDWMQNKPDAIIGPEAGAVFTHVGVGYAVDTNDIPYWELLLIQL